MRVLIIDNDAFSCTHVKMLLQEVGLCEEAGDRDSALAQFRSAIDAGTPYQVVIVDIQVTDTDDDAILGALRTIEDEYAVSPDQRCRIFVATVLSGHQLVTDCLINGCDAFFTKPVEKDRLFGKLDEYGLLAGKLVPTSDSRGADSAISTANILDTIARKLKNGDLELPPAPKIAMRVRQLIDCGAEIKDVVDLLKQDLAVATKLISVSNSAYYRGIEKNTTLSQATNRLGLTRTREVVMSICCRGYFSTNHPMYKAIVEKLWWHSLACAHTAETVAKNHGWQVDEDIFSIGLLHDIGKLLLIQVAGDLDQRKHAKQAVLHVDDLHALMDAHHERLGASILVKLGYPDTFVSLVKRHHHIGDRETASHSLQAVQQADLLAKAAGFGLGDTTWEFINDSMEALGISEQMKDQVIIEIAQRMEQLRYMFG
ncbi:HDOD domain-containing protein [uncultured Desulfosarcina sp.]|uniref:HDOD domain-containing protein n=1 Tax=uncultured Desulfosarcina sp. TaxID=218289 RepID=UPI0029C87385|nr:HDOD domain-containing protein [uncultured Desulfosarcina sp.]